jgi:hypothetical protein
MKHNDNKKSLNELEFMLLSGTDIMINLIRNRKDFSVPKHGYIHDIKRILESFAQGFFYLSEEPTESDFNFTVYCEYPTDIDIVTEFLCHKSEDSSH